MSPDLAEDASAGVSDDLWPTPPAPEVDDTFPRAWVTFVDPANEAQVYRCDLTWLTSRYHCIFGQGCPGTDFTNPDVGCCTVGAYFCDAEDEQRVTGWVERLTPQLWENMPVAADAWVRDVEEEDEDGTTTVSRVTAVKDGGCIFVNGPDFPGGHGCALHHLAAQEGVSFTLTKPEVCWQVPIRRSYRDVELNDGTTYLEISLGEYNRSAWGAGGHDFDWWCSSHPQAHTAPEPLYLTHRDELVDMMGPEAYDALVELCESHLAAQIPLLVHPADGPRND